MGDVLAITGRVLPVTNQNVHLEAEFDNGSRCLGESKIFYAKKLNDCRIRKIRLVPEHPQPLPDALEAIADADVIVLGPGSLYTSIIPNFLVDGISEAVSRAQALKCYVLNIMTQDGETDGYTAADHIKAIFAHAGEDVMDVCIANNRKVSAEFLEPYRKEGVEQILGHTRGGRAARRCAARVPRLHAGALHPAQPRRAGAGDSFRLAGIQNIRTIGYLLTWRTYVFFIQRQSGAL